jgi:hypothetical protein
MQNLSKRQWGGQLSVKGAAEILIDWSKKATAKNVLRKKNPQIFNCYIVKDTPPLQFLQSVGNVFKYTQKDLPYVDQARDSLLRCLSVALKAHYFLFPFDEVAYEPYFFTLPNLINPSMTSFGIVYKMSKDDKSIIVCEKDLSLMFNNEIAGLPPLNNKGQNTDVNIIYNFPVVISNNQYQWFNLKSWYLIKENAGMLDNNNPPWLDKNYLQMAKNARTKEELSQYATIVDVPYNIKDAIKPLGIEWCKGAQTWFLPRGFDVNSVVEYIDYIKHITKDMNLPTLPIKNNVAK